MKTDISRRKLAESAKQLRAVQREQSAAFNTAHAKDPVRQVLDKGDAFTPYRVIGGTANQSSHTSVLQRKIKQNDLSGQLFDKPKKFSILGQEQAAANPAAFRYKSPRCDS